MTRRVLIAPQAFKGTLGPRAVAGALAAGVRRVVPQAAVESMPVADGGDGLLEAVLAPAARRERCLVTGPLGARVEAELAWLDAGTAIFESAAACGLRLVPEGRRDPLVATTRGVGELVAHAQELGARRIVVGLGGSATVDGGTGMARALGWSFLDASGDPLPEGGGALSRLDAVVHGPSLDVEVVGLADVRNPLLGPTGAALTFAPQKGADAAAVVALERGLERLAAWAQRVGAGDAVTAVGAGAAGGLGAGLRLFAGGGLVSGAAWVLERVGFDAALGRAHCVLTAEGAFDATSMAGKATGEIVRRARSRGVPVAVIAGRGDGVAEVPLFIPAAAGRLDGEGIALLAARATAALLGLPAP